MMASCSVGIPAHETPYIKKIQCEIVIVVGRNAHATEGKSKDEDAM